MSRFAFAALFVFATGALAQYDAPAPAPRPSAEEIAFTQLPADIQQMLSGMSAAQAMRMVDQARQQSIALGVPYPTPEQYRTTLGAVLSNTQYVSASAGATTFPPLSPLVPPPSLQR